MYFSLQSLIKHLTVPWVTVMSCFLIIPRLCLNGHPRTPVPTTSVVIPQPRVGCSREMAWFEAALIGHLLMVSLHCLVLAWMGVCPGGFRGWLCPSDLGSGKECVDCTRLELLVILRFVLCQQVDPVSLP